MTKLTTSGVVRDILTRDPEMPSDEVIRQAKTKGLGATDEQIRKSISNQRSPIRAQVAAVKVVPVAAHATAPPKPPVPAPAPTPADVPDLAAVLANVALVNAVVGGASGGVESARRGWPRRSGRAAGSTCSSSTWTWSPASAPPNPRTDDSGRAGHRDEGDRPTSRWANSCPSRRWATLQACG